MPFLHLFLGFFFFFFSGLDLWKDQNTLIEEKQTFINLSVFALLLLTGLMFLKSYSLFVAPRSNLPVTSS